MKETKIYIQGEANKNLNKGDTLFFSADNRDIIIGDYIKLQNYSGTISTTVKITASARKFYRGILTKDEPVSDRMDLTKAVYE
jgi:hypothetical protein